VAPVRFFTFGTAVKPLNLLGLFIIRKVIQLRAVGSCFDGEAATMSVQQDSPAFLSQHAVFAFKSV
jgi:hypothetical protein